MAEEKLPDWNLMRKTLLFLLLAFCLLGCCTQLSGVAKYSSVHRADIIDQETVALIHSFRGRQKVFCTGVWVTETTIMTAGHCVRGLAEQLAKDEAIEEGADPIMVAMGLIEVVPLPVMEIRVPYAVKNEVGLGEMPSALHQSVVRFLSEDHDIALLRAVGAKSLPVHRVAELPRRGPGVGERLYVVGHPGGLYYTHVEGTVAAYRKGVEDTEGPFLQVSAPVWFGNSGGGAFDSEGRLIGIASFMTSVPVCAFFVHLDTLRGIMAGQHLLKLELNPEAVEE